MKKRQGFNGLSVYHSVVKRLDFELVAYNGKDFFYATYSLIPFFTVDIVTLTNFIKKNINIYGTQLISLDRSLNLFS